MRKLILAACCIGLLSSFGCKKKMEPQPAAQPLGETVNYPGNNPRFAVERVAVIYDDIAYSNARGIYILSDSKTGKEYVGLSGVGISELGSHQVAAGKNTVSVPDER